MWIFAIICLGDNMKCPNCGKNIKRRHCMFCGYILDTGYFTEKSKKGEVTLLDTYLGYDYRGHIYEKTVSPEILKNQNNKNILLSVDKMIVFLIDAVKQIKLQYFYSSNPLLFS